jgi:rhomboid protease GluP
MESPPPDPDPGPDPGTEFDEQAEQAELAALGYVPPDPEEPKPVDLWAVVGSERPWGTLLVLFVWAWMFLLPTTEHAYAGPDGLFVWGASAVGEPWRGVAWRLLASTFLHAGAEHLFFNALGMVIVAPAVERIFTRWRFWVFYAVGGYSVGGSGAIFTLGGALLVGAIRLRHRLAPTRARAFGAALLYLIAPAFAGGFTQARTDNVGHAAGLACGALLGALLPMDPRLGGRRPGPVTRVAAVLSVLALAISLALSLSGGLRG